MVGMRGMPVSEKYRGIESDSIIYSGLAKYRPQHFTYITACRWDQQQIAYIKTPSLQHKCQQHDNHVRGRMFTYNIINTQHRPRNVQKSGTPHWLWLVQFIAVRKPLVAIILSFLKWCFTVNRSTFCKKWDGSNGNINMQAVPFKSGTALAAPMRYVLTPYDTHLRERDSARALQTIRTVGFLQLFTIDDVMKYRGIPLSRYF